MSHTDCDARLLLLEEVTCLMASVSKLKQYFLSLMLYVSHHTYQCFRSQILLLMCFFYQYPYICRSNDLDMDQMSKLTMVSHGWQSYLFLHPGFVCKIGLNQLFKKSIVQCSL